MEADCINTVESPDSGISTFVSSETRGQSTIQADTCTSSTSGLVEDTDSALTEPKRLLGLIKRTDTSEHYCSVAKQESKQKFALSSDRHCTCSQHLQCAAFQSSTVIDTVSKHKSNSHGHCSSEAPTIELDSNTTHLTHHASRFSLHNISTLSLDYLVSLATALISTASLVTATTTTPAPAVSVTTPDISESLGAASVPDNVTTTDNMTSHDQDSAAENTHNLSTVLPQLLSMATNVDGSFPSADGSGNDSILLVTPGEKNAHLTEGSIAGIVLGCLAAVVVFSLLMLCFCYKQKKLVRLSPKKKKKKTSHYTGLFDDGISLSYINCQFEPTKDPIDEMSSLDNDAYLNSLEHYMIGTPWSTATTSAANNTPNTKL